MMTDITEEELGKELARELFKLGDEHMRPCSRIEFRAKGKTSNREDEIPQGGLCEIALAMFLSKAIGDILNTHNPEVTNDENMPSH